MATLLSMLSGSKDTKKIKDPVKKREKTGEKPVSQTGQQHGELPTYKVPTPRQQMKEGAKQAKIHATQKWVMGELSNEQHKGIHARADQVLTGKAPTLKLPAKSKGNP